MGRNKFIYFVFFFCGMTFVQAQTVRHVVYLKDKKQSAYSLAQPESYLSSKSISRRVRQVIPLDSTDLPVSETYQNEIKGKGAKLIFSFKWMNAILIEADGAVISDISQLPYVKSITSYNTSLSAYVTSRRASKLSIIPSGRLSASDAYYGNAYDQIEMLGIRQMHQAGYRGEGVFVSVFDNGFKFANQHTAFDTLYATQHVKATYDMADGGNDVYNDGSHGTSVLSCLAACEPGKMVSGAYKANYYLFRTEVDGEETPLELFYWLKAAELSDSIGVDVISSSLGYNTFDDNQYNYSYEDMDGKTTIISKAANWCFQKGMIVVNSAGNEGNTAWHYLLAPGDAPGVLSVGAVDFNNKYASFSSAGPNAAGRIKPDLAAPGVSCAIAESDGTYSAANGTSFAAPNLSALVIGFWQAFPDYTNARVIDILKKSATQSTHPDNFVGSGVPRFDLANNIALGLTDTNLSTAFNVFPNPVREGDLLIRVPQNSIGKNLFVDICTIQGKFIVRKEFPAIANNTEIVVNCSILPNGIYILKVIDHLANIKTFKLVRE